MKGCLTNANMKSLEIDSPAPYIALGVVSKEEDKPAQNRKCFQFTKVLAEVIICCTLIVGTCKLVMVASDREYKLVVEHKYIKPNWWDDGVNIDDWIKKHMENTEPVVAEYATDYYYDEAPLSDKVYRMCANIVPPDWPDNWKDDPQILSARQKDDLDFCSEMFSD